MPNTPSPRLLAALAIAFLAPLPRPALAEISPEAARIVEKYVEAIGGREAIAALRTVHGSGSVEAFGLTGTVRTWTIKPAQRATDMEIGPFTVRQGDDGTRAWRTDPSGKVLVLDGQDLDGARSNTWFDNRMWLEPDQGGGTVSMAPDDEQSDAHAVLDIVSPTGESRRAWFDKSSFLMTLLRVESGGRVAVNEFSEYVEFGGVKFPMVTKTAIQGQEANSVVVRLDSIAVNEDVPVDQFAPPGEALGEIRWLKEEGRAKLGFDYGTRHIWLKVSINGNAPADFLFDTGASITVLDSSYAASIGVTSEGRMHSQGAGAGGGASISKVGTLRLAGTDGDGVELSDVEIAVLSINPYLEPFFWKPCAGVLGFNFINRFVSEVDYDTRTLVLHDVDSFEYAGAGEAIPMTLAGSTPAVRMSINGTYEGEFRVDVGSSATVDLHSPFVREHDLLSRAKRTVEVTSGGFGGGFTSHVTRMKDIELGPFTWKNPIVSLSGATQGALSDPDYAGNIGNRILERFKCTIDYERRMLYLEPGKRYEQRDALSMTGMQIGKYADGFKIVQVIPGSAAEKAGLKVLDVIQSIDGRPVAAYDRMELMELLERGKSGRKVEFAVVRDGTARQITLQLREVI